MNQMSIVFAVNLFDFLPIRLHVFPAEFTGMTIVRRQGCQCNQMILFSNFLLGEREKRQQLANRIRDELDSRAVPGRATAVEERRNGRG